MGIAVGTPIVSAKIVIENDFDGYVKVGDTVCATTDEKEVTGRIASIALCSAQRGNLNKTGNFVIDGQPNNPVDPVDHMIRNAGDVFGADKLIIDFVDENGKVAGHDQIRIVDLVSLSIVGEVEGDDTPTTAPETTTPATDPTTTPTEPTETPKE